MDKQTRGMIIALIGTALILMVINLVTTGKPFALGDGSSGMQFVALSNAKIDSSNTFFSGSKYQALVTIGNKEDVINGETYKTVEEGTEVGDKSLAESFSVSGKYLNESCVYAPTSTKTYYAKTLSPATVSISVSGVSIKADGSKCWGTDPSASGNPLVGTTAQLASLTYYETACNNLPNSVLLTCGTVGRQCYQVKDIGTYYFDYSQLDSPRTAWEAEFSVNYSDGTKKTVSVSDLTKEANDGSNIGVRWVANWATEKRCPSASGLVTGQICTIDPISLSASSCQPIELVSSRSDLPTEQDWKNTLKWQTLATAKANLKAQWNDKLTAVATTTASGFTAGNSYGTVLIDRTAKTVVLRTIDRENLILPTFDLFIRADFVSVFIPVAKPTILPTADCVGFDGTETTVGVQIKNEGERAPISVGITCGSGMTVVSQLQAPTFEAGQTKTIYFNVVGATGTRACRVTASSEGANTVTKDFWCDIKEREDESNVEKCPTGYSECDDGVCRKTCEAGTVEVQGGLDQNILLLVGALVVVGVGMTYAVTKKR